ncbi:UDP-N-acetylmuramoylalanyl-D-glutamyl-2,6-diaminopimelate--D-alanyl-D-alanine ligase [Aureimonas leprariae]|uniref:UDP-N-acetylmuramoyl-tripeptide--D-alanyl-D-alanine ligase n=1 Tax=Plantimonas leprariae TaxID=2615207 RepID=A0A7V7PR20_9HYPH|nr:UDP-N-acetylmuramoylalanyl-D-glutamyl-2,6-diaminopimelate--D-alanyl-D-alanine ligase [Aureimonas leprariae]KAB0680820.1 UDP-N-acetylmuramoylalanyl-D-glutamyl-2,6-diaminopimelate--D-alanyl-D-alanine ligase [Aureimonas leprariae]
MSENWLWESDALLAALGGRAHGALPGGVTGLSIDTRTLKAGDAFFAIKGDRFDGHNYLTAARSAGASVFVVAQSKLPALGKVLGSLIVVDDVLAALGRLASASRARSKAKIVAVTGSVGKTTTKEALRHALEASGPVHASAASFNNHWGVPLSLARMPADARYGVFEIGMNHPGEIRPLVKLVRPHAAIVTLIAPAHLGFFRDLDEIAVAKGEIFEGVVEGGTAILNADDPYHLPLAEMARQAGVNDIKLFGENAEANYRLADFQPMPGGARMRANIAGEDVDVDLPTMGRHIAQNLLAVLGTASVFGADVAATAAALSSWRAGKGRGARHHITLADGRRFELIDESYNANPASMRAAIAVLGASNPKGNGRRIAVLGDMLELGDGGPAMHAELAEPLEAAKAERVYMLGEAMKALDDALDGRLPCEWHQSFSELETSLIGQVRDGDVLMVKASNSIGLSKIVDRLTAASSSEPSDPAAASRPSQGQ